MTAYVMLLAVPLLLQHTRIRGISYRRRNEMALFLFFAWLTVLVALRHETVGKDTAVYARYFTRWARLDWQSLRRVEMEPGFVLLNKLISFFSDEPQVLLAVSAALVSAMIYPTYRRLCVDASLTILLFCTMSTFFMLFSGIRQMLAVGLGFAAYECTRRKRWGLFLLTVVGAMVFHTSAFMLLFMYSAYHARISGKWLAALVPVYVLRKPAFSMLAAVLERFTGYEAEITSTGAYTMLILFALFAVFTYVIPDEGELDEETRGMRNFLLLALLVQMFAPLHMLAMRMNYYYIIFIPLLLPRVISARRGRWNKVALLARHIMVLFFLVYFFFSGFRGGNLNFLPYHFFWETV